MQPARALTLLRGLGTECNLPTAHCQAPWTKGWAQQGGPLWPKAATWALLQVRPGRAWAGNEVMQAAPCTATRVLPPGSATSQGKLQGLKPPPDKAHYLRTTCSDTLMLRHRKASAAELSLNSLTGGELFKPCLGGLAILKLPDEEGRPKPQRAQLPGGESKPLEG